MNKAAGEKERWLSAIQEKIDKEKEMIEKNNPFEFDSREKEALGEKTVDLMQKYRQGLEKFLTNALVDGYPDKGYGDLVSDAIDESLTEFACLDNIPGLFHAMIYCDPTEDALPKLFVDEGKEFPKVWCREYTLNEYFPLEGNFRTLAAWKIAKESFGAIAEDHFPATDKPDDETLAEMLEDLGEKFESLIGQEDGIDQTAEDFRRKVLELLERTQLHIRERFEEQTEGLSL